MWIYMRMAKLKISKRKIVKEGKIKVYKSRNSSARIKIEISGMTYSLYKLCTAKIRTCKAMFNSLHLAYPNPFS